MTKRLTCLALSLLIILGVFSAFSASAEDVKIISEKTMQVGQTSTVGMTDPDTNQPITTVWGSDNPAIASVSSDGKVKAVGVGTCILSAVWNSKIYGVKVTVTAAAASVSAFSKLKNYLLKSGTKKDDTYYYIEWENDSYKFWVSYNSKSKYIEYTVVQRRDADTDNGMLTIVQYESTNKVQVSIQWTSDGKSTNIGRYSSAVKRSSFNINKTIKLSYKSGKKYSNIQTVYKNQLNAGLPQWESWLSKTLGLSLKKMGVVSSASKASSKKIALSKKSATITKGSKLKLKLNNAKASKVKWSSSKKKVATVSKKGVVKAKKKGKTTVTAKYKGKKYKCKITVKAKTNNFSKLKNYLLKKGTKKPIIGGNIYMAVINNNYTLHYDTTDNTFYFVRQVEDGSSTTNTTMRVKSNKTAMISHDVFGSQIGNCTADIVCSKLTKDISVNFKIGQYNTISTIVSDAKTSLKTAMPVWNGYIKSKAGVSLKQLGFTKW